MLYKIVNGLAPPYLECYVNKRSAIHSYNTRSRDNLVVSFCRTATAQSATLSVFKRAVKRKIYDSP
ncbi:unnamed protein product [Pocillopora meandrina]|uniref:Uncharacterized protein n=1 Tax=Pocillopora meandrina TaxID=46732 RepID=A0AAU9VZY8_9CNID|nr:unnamed protein product [Pocillopora meandrina]